MAQQRGKRLAVVDDESEVLWLLGIARLVMRCIPQARMDNISLPLISEQEERIFNEARAYLASLADLLTVIPERTWSPVDLLDLTKSLKVDLIQPLTVLCEHLPGGTEVIPEGLLETVDHFRLWTFDRYGWGLEWEFNGYIGTLEMAIKKWKYNRVQGVRSLICLPVFVKLNLLISPQIPKACLSFGQRPIVPF